MERYDKIITGKERQALTTEGFINEYNPQSDAPPVFKTVTEWLDQGFGRNEQLEALHFGPKSLRYNQLQKLSNQIANYLIEKGIKKGDRVGICLGRSFELVACIIGILKSGAAYVPLDPNYPAERLGMMKEDAKLSLLITHATFSGQFDPEEDKAVLWEKIKNKIASCPAKPPSVIVEAEDIAYVIFTSGSTGRPKGIAMPHRALANLIEWQLQRDYFTEEAHVLQYSSISFDVSFQEIATTLASGGTLYLMDDTERRDPRILLQKIKEWKIERLFIPFVALRSLIEVATSTNSMPHSLQEVITAGEQLRVDDDVRAFFSQLPNSVLDNQYGPSETHVISAHLLGANPSEWPDLPPIGTPLKNTGIYLLDEHMQPVEEGKTGELYLAGRNLAQGYIGRDDLTREAFVKNPFDQKSHPVLYKTGDLGLVNKEGVIEFLGRSDHQIKIRGYRIEPGEINAVGAKFPGIAHCFTHSTDDPAGKAQLITYFVKKNGATVDPQAFKLHLSQSLPDYMLPAFITGINEIPYTPSGKVDIKALPKPRLKGAAADTGEKIEYQSETEAKLARIWSRILGFETISRTTSFFDLGGDSLLAVTLFLEIENEFGKALPLSTLIHADTVAELTQHIDSRDKDVDFSKFRSLQLLQKGDSSEVPLFLVHGGEGNVLVFQELVKKLDSDQPVFAFQWSGWDGYKGQNDILEMAKFYKQELLEAWPDGPYRIGGHCIGGVIAIELANLLKTEGAEVLDPVLIVDSPNLNSKQYQASEPEESEKDLRAFKAFAKRLQSKLPDYTQDPSPAKTNRASINNDEPEQLSFPRRVLKPFKKLPFYNSSRNFLFACYNSMMYPLKNSDEVKRSLTIFTKLMLSKPIPIEYRAHYCATNMIYAIKKQKKTVYDGDMLYFRSELLQGRFLGLEGWWDDLFMGFGELCSGRFDAYLIGGDHSDILKYPRTHKIIKDKIFTHNQG